MAREPEFTPEWFQEKYQPHWFWALTFVLIPLILIVVGFLGSALGSVVPLSVAIAAPKLAVVVAVIGMAAALIRRRKVPIELAVIGLALSVSGYLLLFWFA